MNQLVFIDIGWKFVKFGSFSILTRSKWIRFACMTIVIHHKFHHTQEYEHPYNVLTECWDPFAIVIKRQLKLIITPDEMTLNSNKEY